MGTLRTGFVAGLVATMIMIAIMLLFRIFADVPTFFEVSESPAISLVPLNVFSSALTLLGAYAKILLYGILVLVQVFIGGIIGIGYAYISDKIAHEQPASDRRWVLVPRRLRDAAWRNGLTPSILLWFITMALIYPVLDAGEFGNGLRTGPVLASGSMLIAFLAYGVSMATLYRSFSSPMTTEVATADTGRRQVVIKLGVGLVVLLAGGLVLKVLVDAIASARASTRRTAAGPVPEITPNSDFYKVSKNFVDPTVNESQWKLEISGLVDRPYQLNYQELRGLPYIDQYATLECISNEVGGDLISNALWRGVPLADILQRAGVKSGATKVVLSAGDDYSDSILLDKALDKATFLAYDMNGVALPLEHGFPARLVVPNIYGMKNVKWLTGIKLVDTDYQGYWQKQGWSDKAEIRTMSRIDVPGNGSTVPANQIEIDGIAFAGSRGISRLEVSTDDGKTWEDAILKKALSPYTWVIWTKSWQPMRTGRHTVLVRATDGTGTPQISTRADTLPDGATGYHTIVVRVDESIK